MLTDQELYKDILPEEIHLGELVAQKELVTIYKDLADSEKVLETIDELLVLESRIQQYVDKGTKFNKTAFSIYNRALESIVSRCPVKCKAFYIGLEAYDNSSRSLQHLTITHEGLIDTIKEYGKKFGEYILEIWKKIMEFFKGMFGRKDVLEEKVKKLIDEVDKIPDHAKAVEEYITSKVVTESSDPSNFLDNNILFYIKDKCNGQSTLHIIENTITLLDMNRVIIADMAKCMQHILNENPTVDSLQIEADKLVGLIKNKMEHFTSTQRKNEGNQVTRTYGYFHDGNLFRMSEEIGKKDVNDEVKLFNLELDIVKVKDGNYQVEVLTKEEMKKIADMALKLIDKSRDFDKVVPIADKAVRTTSEKLHNLFLDFSDQETKDGVKASVKMTKEVFHYVKRYLPKVAQIANFVASDASTYVRASVARYKAQQA